jgi:hypothetical protein
MLPLATLAEPLLIPVPSATGLRALQALVDRPRLYRALAHDDGETLDKIESALEAFERDRYR